MSKRLYLTPIVFLMKLYDWVFFVSNEEDFSEPIYREDIYINIYIQEMMVIAISLVEETYSLFI